MALNSRGQAAVTDALFLLVVVGILSSSLVYFSIQYGSTINRYVSNQYIVDFENSALKTMLYSSVPRDFSASLYDAQQVDYLLAIVKEDYLGDSKLDLSTMTVLRNSSKIAVKPLASNFDYLVFIQTVESPSEFVYIYLNSSTCDIDSGCSGTGGKSEYYCKAKDFENVQSFLESVGYFSPVVSGIKLSKATSTNDTEPLSAIIELAMWVGSPLNSEKFLLQKTIYLLPDTDSLDNVKFNDSASPACNPDSSGQCRGILACKKIEP